MRKVSLKTDSMATETGDIKPTDNSGGCSISGCKEKGIQKYQIILNLCKKHSIEANKTLKKRNLKVNSDGSYSKIKKIGDK